MVDWTSNLPLWSVFVLTFAIGWGATETGTLLAAMVMRRTEAPDPEGPLGSMVGALLGLLAFILAFTFGLAGTRFDARKQLVLDEANALGTTYLRADLLPQPQGQEIQRLLREYTDLRVNSMLEDLHETLKRSEEIHFRLWAQVNELAREDMDSEMRALFIDSLNELIDLHQSRVTIGLQYRIPATVWFVTFILSALSMLAVGYQVGMSGVRRLRGTPLLVAAFSVVIVMIADIDRPGEGLMQVSQQPIADARQMMLRHSGEAAHVPGGNLSK